MHVENSYVRNVMHTRTGTLEVYLYQVPGNKNQGDVRYLNFGTKCTNVTGNTRKTHIWFCYRCYRKEKAPMNFHQRGIHVRFSPQGVHVCCPPPTCCRCSRKGCFFHQKGSGINVCCVLVRILVFGWVSTRYVGVFLPGTLCQFLLHCAAKNCYPPPISVICVLPLQVTYIPDNNVSMRVRPIFYFVYFL